MAMIGSGLYSLAQAARLIHSNSRSLRRWLLGYKSKRGDRSFYVPPLWIGEHSEEDLPEPTIGFADLMELRFVDAFVKAGVDLRIVRATLEVARQDLDTSYPFTSRRFLTDGRRIFAQALEQAREEQEKSDEAPFKYLQMPQLFDVLQRQFVFSDIIKSSLYAGIEYEGQGARRWFPLGADRKVIQLDPAIQFGTPVIVGPSIPTDTLYASYLAEGRNAAHVARIFAVKPGQVNAAVRFEEALAA